MPEKCVSEAVILRKRNYRNTSAILTMYTRDMGKQVFMARGIRRYSHRASAVDQGYFGFVEYIPRPDAEVQLLTNFELYSEFYTTRNSLEQIYLQAQILHLVEMVTMIDSCDKALFDLLYETLLAVAAGAQREILPWFLVSMLDKMGIHTIFPARNWMNSTLNYMIENSISRVNTLKLSEEQISAILVHVRRLLLEGLHVDVDFKRARPLEYLNAS